MGFADKLREQQEQEIKRKAEKEKEEQLRHAEWQKSLPVLDNETKTKLAQAVASEVESRIADEVRDKRIWSDYKHLFGYCYRVIFRRGICAGNWGDGIYFYFTTNTHGFQFPYNNFMAVRGEEEGFDKIMCYDTKPVEVVYEEAVRLLKKGGVECCCYRKHDAKKDFIEIEASVRCDKNGLVKRNKS